ncbi:M23 family metallopeptidase [Bacillus mexicanus]|uniref:M23 family metallopeptidase n=1 Tax=Bacillus mexicanus TaxID=2834415 RepID=UPI003D1984BC
MKRTVAVIILIYAIIYSVYPNQSKIQINEQSKAKESVANIKLSYQNGKVILDNFKEDDDERFWGTLNNLRYMVYKNINDYIYVNGEFYPVNGEWNNGKFYLPEKSVTELFSLEGKRGQYHSTNKIVVNGICQNINQNANKKTVLNVLNNPSIPIEHAKITKQEGQLPGASREYRNGKHEGFDWYAGAIGIEITRKTLVHPIFDGRIVRIDKDFTELKPTYRQKLLNQASKEKNTSQETLDKLRGRQVWIQSDNGILVHYAHLSSVNEDLNVGDKVTETDWIAHVGNSGTSNGALGTDDDLHLHSDILVCGKNFWEYGELNDMNNSVIAIFDKVSKNKTLSQERMKNNTE